MQHNPGQNFYIHFGLGDGHFLIAIDQIDEVLDLSPITPFPIEAAGYLGIVNLRGQVLPVLSIQELAGAEKAEADLASSGRGGRLIRFHLDETRRFCIVVAFARKVALATKLESDGSTVNLSGQPVRLVTRAELVGSRAHGGTNESNAA